MNGKRSAADPDYSQSNIEGEQMQSQRLSGLILGPLTAALRGISRKHSGDKSASILHLLSLFAGFRNNVS